MEGAGTPGTPRSPLLQWIMGNLLEELASVYRFQGARGIDRARFSRVLAREAHTLDPIQQLVEGGVPSLIYIYIYGHPPCMTYRCLSKRGRTLLLPPQLCLEVRRQIRGAFAMAVIDDTGLIHKEVCLVIQGLPEDRLLVFTCRADVQEALGVHKEVGPPEHSHDVALVHLLRVPRGLQHLHESGVAYVRWLPCPLGHDGHIVLLAPPCHQSHSRSTHGTDPFGGAPPFFGHALNVAHIGKGFHLLEGLLGQTSIIENVRPGN